MSRSTHAANGLVLAASIGCAPVAAQSVRAQLGIIGAFSDIKPTILATTTGIRLGVGGH